MNSRAAAGVECCRVNYSTEEGDQGDLLMISSLALEEVLIARSHGGRQMGRLAGNFTQLYCTLLNFDAHY